jgi:hypothetical protein
MTAQAGSGKTRLIREWLKRHPEVHALAANFSLFGGGVENFASQLAELPPDRLDCSALVDAVVAYIRKEKIELLVVDDLHWAEEDGSNLSMRCYRDCHQRECLSFWPRAQVAGNSSEPCSRPLNSS